MTKFKFDDLSDTAKEKARDWFREGNLNYEWWEHVYNEAVRFGSLIGIEISTSSFSYIQGTPLNSMHLNPAIYFSGFGSQGDGCSFCGRIYAANMKGSIKHVMQEVNEADLIALATKAEELYGKAIASWTKVRLEGIEDFIDTDMRFDIRQDHDFSCIASIFDSESHCADLEQDIQNFANSFARWIYKQLEAEYNHLTSDETVDENIRANEYLFDEFGSKI